MFNQNTPNRDALITLRNRQYIKSFLARPFLITAAIIIIISLVLTLITALVQTVAGVAAFIEFIVDRINENIDTKSNLSLSTNLNISLESLLLVASMFAMVIASRKGKKQTAPCGAVSVFFVWTVITMVGDLTTALAYLIAPIIFAAIIGIISQAGNVDIATQLGIQNIPQRVINVAVVILCAFLLLHAVLYIIRGINRFRFGSSLRKSVVSGTLSAKGCTAYAATNIIICILLFFSTILSTICLHSFISGDLAKTTDWGAVISKMPLTLLSVCSFIITSLSCVIPLLMSIFALSYQKHINAAGENGCNLPEPMLPVAPVTKESPCETTNEEDATDSAQNNNPYSAIVAPAPQKEAETAENASTRFCYMCGEPVTPDQSFCIHCGNKLN